MSGEVSGAYEGYHREWRPDPNWRYGTKYKLCRIPRCLNSPVAEMDRLVRYRRTEIRKQPYAYCAEHLYGRKIENGQVLHSILVPDEPMTANHVHNGEGSNGRQL